jgi:hypothetical protein
MTPVRSILMPAVVEAIGFEAARRMPRGLRARSVRVSRADGGAGGGTVRGAAPPADARVALRTHVHRMRAAVTANPAGAMHRQPVDGRPSLLADRTHRAYRCRMKTAYPFMTRPLGRRR